MNLSQLEEAQRDLARVVREALAYGPDPALARQYRERRAEIQSGYALVRTRFSPLWTTSRDPRRFPAQHTDPFESLLEAPTLEGLLSRDARFINRDLEDIQTAFELCGELSPVVS